MSTRISDYKVSIRVILDPKGILQMEREWNTLVNRSYENPFLLSEFVKQFMESNRYKGWTPIILAISANHKILGIAPLVTKKKFGVRCVRSPTLWCGEFIVDHQHRKVSIEYIFYFLFKTLNCKSADFDFSGDSPNLEVLKQQCKINRIYFKTVPAMGHRIIPIRCTWTEFWTRRGKKFRQEFKRIERLLNQAGSWKTVCVEGTEQSDAIGKILDVERRSWKEKFRSQRGEKEDEFLQLVLRASQHTARIEQNFNWSVWFLELNDNTIAYCLVFQYKEVAFLVKTSYDEQYKRFWPGKYIQNSVIHELFNKGQIKYIDFLSDLPYLQTWTDERIPRITARLAAGILPTIILFMFENAYFRKIRLLFNSLAFH